MYLKNQSTFISPAFRLLVVLPLLILLSSVNKAQSSTDSVTPGALTPGSPVGSYSLGDFDTVNLYNGHLNFVLPLLKMGGRGSSVIPIVYKHEQIWRDETYVTNCPPSCTPLYYPTYNWWTSVKPVYGMGFLEARDSYEGVPNCLDVSEPYRYSLTRLTFTAPDGTEYQFVDQATLGKPLELDCNLSAINRGRIFVTTDGSQATFISDTPLIDGSLLPPGNNPTGYLMMKDGSRYRIENGYVKWMRDRNGNQVTITYGAPTEVSPNLPYSRPIKITDSLNREVTIEYDVNDSQPYGLCDRITFKGFGGVPRVIRISKRDLNSDYLRAGFVLRSDSDLFPGMTGASMSPPTLGPRVTTAIWLPDGRSYKFLYNDYYELARVLLPTGGAVEYDYVSVNTNLQGLPIFSISGLPNRRVIEKRVYPDGGSGSAWISKTNFTPFFMAQQMEPTGTVSVTTWNSSNTIVSKSRHHFLPFALPIGDANDGAPGIKYTDPREGREHKTEEFGANNSTVLRTVDQMWASRLANSWTSPYPPPCMACAPFYGPPIDLRVAETALNLNDANQLSKQTFSYDQYNNQTDIWEYDFGTSSPGTLIRHTHTDYKTASYDTIVGGTGNPDPIATIHIRSLPELQTVKDASGVIRAKTTYEYDAGLLEAPENYGGIAIPGLVSRGGLTQAQGYNPASDLPRGNVTRVTRWLLANTGLVAQDTGLHTLSRYDVAGNVVKVWDAKGNETSFDYSDSFSGDFTPNTFAFLKSSTSPTPSTGYGGGQALVSTSVYDFQSGKVVLTRDPNNRETTFEYNDPLDRLTRVVRPMGGGETVFEYGFGDGPSLNPNNPEPDDRYIRTRTKQNSNTWIEDYGFYDGLGRTWRSAHVEGTNYFSVRDSQFDALGRANKVSNPYFFNGTFDQLVASEASNTNLTVTTFDALGRATRVTTPDGSHVDTEYAGNKVTVKDQKENARSSITDGLGRLIQVNEDPSVTAGDNHLNYQTNYTYDVLGNLIRVRQGGFPTGGSTDPSVQFRRFYYDSLSRLVYANNLEQDATIPFNPPNESGTKWTMKYVYDANGNLTSRTEARIVPASLLNVTTTYGYDALNRNTTVDYNDGTAAIRRYYDVSTNGDGGATPFTNGKGRLRRVESLNIYPGTTQHAYSRTVIDGYDALGRITSQKQGFGNNADSYADYAVSRAYDLASHTIFQSYPSTNTVGYLYGADGRLTNFNGYLGNQNGDAFAKEMSYNAAGQMLREKVVTQSTLYHHTKYNNRFQMVEVSVGTNSDGSSNADDVWNRGRLQFFYNSSAVAGGNPAQDGTDNNGNVLRQKHLVPLTSGGYAIPMQDDYFYDPINRLTQVKGYQQSQGGSQGGSTFAQIYQQTYSYDKFGNRKLYLNASDPSGTTWGNRINGTSPSHIWEPDKKTNRLMAVTYDAAGNMIKDVYSARTDTKVYDAENRMTKSVGGGNTNYYVYDGDGRRVRRIVGGSGSNSGEYWQVYGIDGELLAEYKLVAGSPVLQKEYGYRSGQLLVIGEPQIGITPAQVKWLVADHLGTPRIIVDSTGSLSNVRRHDYLPFGEELAVGMGNGSIRTGAGGMGYVADGVRQKFTGYERDGETDLDFAQARYYSNKQGRFTSPDPFNPIFEVQGEAFRNWISESQRWNKYSYTLNNPLKYVDEDGQDPLQIIKDGSRRIAQLVAKIAQRSGGVRTHPLVMTAEVLKTALDIGFPSLNVIPNGIKDAHEIQAARLVSAFEGKSFEGVKSANAPGVDGFLYSGSSLAMAQMRGAFEAVQLQTNSQSKDTLGNIFRDADAHEGKVAKSGNMNVHLFIAVTDPNTTASQVLNRIQADARAGVGIVNMTTRQHVPKVTILTTDGAIRVQNGKIYSCDQNANCTNR